MYPSSRNFSSISDPTTSYFQGIALDPLFDLDDEEFNASVIAFNYTEMGSPVIIKNKDRSQPALQTKPFSHSNEIQPFVIPKEPVIPVAAAWIPTDTYLQEANTLPQENNKTAGMNDSNYLNSDSNSPVLIDSSPIGGGGSVLSPKKQNPTSNVPVSVKKDSVRMTIARLPPPTEKPLESPCNLSNPPSPPPNLSPFFMYDPLCSSESQLYPNPSLPSPPPIASPISGPKYTHKTVINEVPLTVPNKTIKKRKTSIPSNKKGKKHSNITMEEELGKSFQSTPDLSGVTPYYPADALLGPPLFAVINEDKFYQSILSSRPEEYKLDKASLLEKFDKSRPCNRVNPKDKTGKIPIKYLRIDNRKKNPDFVKKQISNIKTMFPKQKIRVISHRDWNYISPDDFIYEPKKK